jgi:hypothetical protein
MRRTMADVLEEKGALKKSRETLLRLLKRRFGNVPAAASATIRTTDDPEQLDEWLDQVVTAATLDDVGIGTPVQSRRCVDIVPGPAGSTAIWLRPNRPFAARPRRPAPSSAAGRLCPGRRPPHSRSAWRFLPSDRSPTK